MNKKFMRQGGEGVRLTFMRISMIVTTLLPECITTYTPGGENVPGAKFSARVTKPQMDLTTVSTRGLRR